MEEEDIAVAEADIVEDTEGAAAKMSLHPVDQLLQFKCVGRLRFKPGFFDKSLSFILLTSFFHSLTRRKRSQYAHTKGSS